MSFAEMAEFVEGLEMRRRERWEQTRYIMHAAFQAQCTRRISLTDVLRFHWDTAADGGIDDSDDARARLAERAKAMACYFQNKN